MKNTQLQNQTISRHSRHEHCNEGFQLKILQMGATPIDSFKESPR